MPFPSEEATPPVIKMYFVSIKQSFLWTAKVQHFGIVRA